MTGLTSVISAQALLAAITLTYGSAFLGLWLQYRRPAMRAFALAWLGLGLYSAISIVALLVTEDSAGVAHLAFSSVIGVVGVSTALWVVNAAYSVVDPGRPRRRLWQVGLVVGAVQLGFVVLEGPHDTTMRLIVLAALAWACFVAVRAPDSPGRRSMIAALALLLFRPVFAIFALTTAPAGEQPAWYTILQVLVTMSAGFLATVAVFSIERDSAVRDRAAFERQLAQSQRMDSLGRMASSVAHDFNNILAAVMAASEFASDDRSTPDERRDSQTDIMAAARRGKELTHRLLAFARPGTSAPVEFDPARRVLDLLPMIERLVGRHCTVSCTIADAMRAHTLVVRADPVQFDQVMLNLAANARDAMPDGGVLRIHCDLVDSPHLSGEATVRAGRHVRVDVTDSGTGMTRETADRVFEPFFTTKDDGRGTGLGLATAFTFAQQALGVLQVASVVGQGTTFSLYLPLGDATPSP